MTRCGSQLETPTAVFSRTKNVDENAKHLDGSQTHVDENPPDAPFKYHVEWMDEQKRLSDEYLLLNHDV